MTYTELQARIALWLNRSDLTDVIPLFIELAEERFNRHLRVRDMEIALASTPIVDGVVTIAADVADVKVLWVGSEPRTLTRQSLEKVISDGSNGIPTIYAMQGQTLQFNGGGDVSGVLYEKIPALSTASTNWLSEKAWSVYLFGALVEAKVYTGADPSGMEAKLQSALSELTGNEQRYSGPLVAVAR